MRKILVLLALTAMSPHCVRAGVIAFPVKAREVCGSVFSANGGITANLIPPWIFSNRLKLTPEQRIEQRQLAYTRSLLGLTITSFDAQVPSIWRKRIEAIYRQKNELGKHEFAHKLTDIVNSVVQPIQDYGVAQLKILAEFGRPPSFFDFSKIEYYERTYRKPRSPLVSVTSPENWRDGYFAGIFDLPFQTDNPAEWRELLDQNILQFLNEISPLKN